MRTIFERLYVCWLVLTSHSYYTFFVSKKRKVRGCFIEKPSRLTDEAIISYIRSELYKKYIEKEYEQTRF